MKLLDLSCAGVRGLPDGRYAFTDPHRGSPLDVAIVTGGPASGKTTLLEAIAGVFRAAGAPVALPERARWLRAGVDRGRIEATWLLSAEEHRRAGVEEPRQAVIWDLGDGAPRPDVVPGLRRLFAERAPGAGTMEYVPANRILDGRSRGPMTEAAERRARLMRDPDKYAGLVPYLVEASRAAQARVLAMVEERGVLLRREIPDALAPFKEAVSAMVPGLRLLGVDGDRLRFGRRDRTVLDLDDLSESERQGVLFALAFRRFDLAGSVVLVDEPELHVHASERARFLQAIVVLGKGNQVIAATGAAEIVAAASAGQVIEVGRSGSVLPRPAS